MAITSRVYPTLDEEVHLYLFNNGSTPIRVTNLDVYKMTEVDMINIWRALMFSIRDNSIVDFRNLIIEFLWTLDKFQDWISRS